MEVINERCCGLDVHKKRVVACVITPQGQETRTFSTLTQGLLELAAWLGECQVSHVAMESSGVFWKPVYNLLEGLDLTLLVVNARQIKAVPGRKTDVKDAQWIADLLRHGLLRGSYIPERPQRELRELVPYRRSLIRQRAQVVNRIQQVLEGANIKLSSVASNVVGVSGRAMREALARGSQDPAQVAVLAKGRLRAKQPALVEALRGLMETHQRLLLQSPWRHLDFLAGEIEQLNEEVAVRMGPFAEAIAAADARNSIGRQAAEEILAELGTDLGRFPSEAHLSSWAKVCPGNHQSAGKRKSGATGQGNPWLRSALVEAAWGAVRTRGSYRAARRGAKGAIVAVAHSILVILYHLLQRGTTYQDLGSNYFSERDQQGALKRAIRRIELLGYKVTLETA
jgi:transposase